MIKSVKLIVLEFEQPTTPEQIQGVEDQIAELGEYEKPMSNLWMVATDKSDRDVLNELKPKLKKNDRALVITTSRFREMSIIEHRIPKEVSDWMNEYR